jgi:hypothetical protein
MNNILLLGAGFSRNWGGRLASEVRSDLQAQLLGEPYISRLLQQHDFESVISVVQAEFGQKPNELTEGRLRATQAAVNDVFSRMNLAFQRRTAMEFGGDTAFRIQPYLAKFDSIFSINQDLLLELHYRRDDPSVWVGTKWNGYSIPGMIEKPLTTPYPYNSLLSKWNPTGDFQLISGQQPFIKLHGSSNWESATAEPMLVIGKAKVAQINQHSVVKSAKCHCRTFNGSLRSATKSATRRGTANQFLPPMPFEPSACATDSRRPTTEIHCTKTSMIARRGWLRA